MNMGALYFALNRVGIGSVCPLDGAWMIERCSLKRARFGRLFEDFLLVL